MKQHLYPYLKWCARLGLAGVVLCYLVGVMLSAPSPPLSEPPQNPNQPKDLGDAILKFAKAPKPF